MTRDEAMRAAAETVTIDWEPEREEVAIATAGADAELARVVGYLRKRAEYWRAVAMSNLHQDFLDAARETARHLDKEANALAARAHWTKESNNA